MNVITWVDVRHLRQRRSRTGPGRHITATKSLEHHLALATLCLHGAGSRGGIVSQQVV